MKQDELKRLVAEAALAQVKDDMVLGVGTGSTVNFFIDALAASTRRLAGVASSSQASTERLQGHGIEVNDLNQLGNLDLYVDGADEVDPHRRLIKGGGGALTREKIVAACAQRFLCIVDQSKLVPILGQFPLPLEVIPMARSYVARKMVERGGQPQLREDFISDNGNQLLDVRNLDLTDPVTAENDFNNIPGVVTVGLFCIRPADQVLVASDSGVRSL